MSGAPGILQKATEDSIWTRSKSAYFYLIVILTLTISLVSFGRVRDQGLANVSLWFFAIPFLLTLARTRLGLIATVFLLTIAPALHHQLNAIAGTRLQAWAFPGVDVCLGFVFAWVCTGGLTAARSSLSRFPAGPLLLLHAWVAFSALVSIARNLWQSASELSLRGVAYNVWLTRGISWHDDYYPLQDLFFYSAALAMMFSVWTVMAREGGRILRSVVIATLLGAVLNVAFAFWQKMTRRGWIDGDFSLSVNAFWPDLHSFGGLMAVALFLGYGLIRTQPASVATRVAIGLAMSVAAFGLYLSSSRSTLLIVCVVLVLWGIWRALKLKGWRRAIPLLAIAALLAAIDWLLDRGYRGNEHASLSALSDGFTAEKLNVALSYRPEIWGAAIDMYSVFPFFGLGQGSFYRLSSLPAFSDSEVLLSFGGSGAHNYLLQTFVELGPVGLLFALLVAIPVFRLGKQNLGLISFYALLGIGVGNIYAHSLLVRETLMLGAVFGGIYCWECEAHGAARWRPVEPGTTRFVSWGVAVFFLLGIVEVAQSFSRTPFNFGERCFEHRQVAQDGWTSGLLRQPIPATAARIDIALLAERPDLKRRPLAIDLSVAAENGATVWSHSLEVNRPSSEPRRFTIELPEPPSRGRFLLVKSSHCFVPLNLGLTYDPRRLGVRVPELRFRTRAGTDVDLP
jgi:hypothetical protein